MMWCRVLLMPLVFTGLVSRTSAGPGIFASKPKPNPAERTPELLIQLKTSRDEAQRAAAAEELRLYDPKAFPEILTALIDALGKDASTTVRSAAAESLGKLRPISQKVGYTLEQAVTNDGSLRVRLAARQALWQYHLVGYRSGKPQEPETGNGSATVSAPPGPSTSVSALQRPLPAAVPNGSYRETAEPPLADAPAATVTIGRPVVPATPVSRPLSEVPAPFKLIPSTPPPLKPVPMPEPPRPATKPDADGPALPPPG